MRNSYLESYYNLIPKIQQERLLEVLKSKYDEAQQSPDDTELQAQMEKLIAELRKPLGDPLIIYREAKKYSKIRSSDYNNMMEEAYVDLGALFKQDNLISRTIKTHKLLNDSVLKDVKSALRKIENDIMVYKVVKENKTGITDAKYNTFYKDDNQTEKTVFKAWTDTDTNSIKLPAGMDHSALSINGLAMAEIDITHYGGGIRGTIETEEHRKERAIDESLQTFWGEVILTDEPIRQVYNGSTYFGAICEIVVTLFRRELVNHIKYLPFTNYPLDIVKIEYKSASDLSWVDIGVTTQSSTSCMEFNFDEVAAKEIRIVVNQKNPSINTYKLPKRVVNSAQMWQQIVDREYSVSTDTTSPIQATQDMIDYVTGWQAYVDAVGNYKDRIKKIGKPKRFTNTQSISETLFDAATDEMTKTSEQGADELKLDTYGDKAQTEDELVEVRKYEYVYGSYNIDIKRLWYLEHGEYVSPKYQSNGAVLESKIDVNEILPSGTTIEYQVSTRPTEWKNITPSGQYMSSERLDIDPLTLSGILRFPASGVVGVYRNSENVPVGDYTFTAASDTIVIDAGWYVANASYTVSYEPIGISDVTPSGSNVSFANDSLINADEIYSGTESRQYKVELEHYPYVNNIIINDTAKALTSSPNFSYTTGRWMNISTGTLYGIEANDYYDVLTVTVDGHDAENRTDYYKGIRPALTEYNQSSYPSFEYFHAGRNLYFNTPLKGREVGVDYYYLNDYIQLRALLRSNVRSNVTTTPVLEDYTLKLRTI